MFVYQGRFNWQHYAENETCLVVLPSGPVQFGDVIYLFTQWTVDSKGEKKVNYFHPLPIHHVAKTAEGEDTFSARPSYYSFDITTSGAYENLTLTMSNPWGYKSSMEFKRVWQSKGQPSTEPGRIWTGKFNWSTLATDEPVIFIVPQGFGEGRPVLSLWQWTSDGGGTEKSPCFHAADQEMLPGAPDGAKFSYHSDYDVTCTWDERSEILSVHMKGPEAERQLGEFELTAFIDQSQSDVTDLKNEVKKLEEALDSDEAKIAKLTTSLAETTDALTKAEASLKTELSEPRLLSKCCLYSMLTDDHGQRIAKVAYEHRLSVARENCDVYNNAKETQPWATFFWDVYSFSDSETRVVIKSAYNSWVLFSKGDYEVVGCRRHDISDPRAQWEMEGGTIHTFTDINPKEDNIRFRNVGNGTYLELQDGDLTHGTPFITSPGNGDDSQKFKISRRR